MFIVEIDGALIPIYITDSGWYRQGWTSILASGSVLSVDIYVHYAGAR